MQPLGFVGFERGSFFREVSLKRGAGKGVAPHHLRGCGRGLWSISFTSISGPYLAFEMGCIVVVVPDVMFTYNLYLD
jgi:hypothetical protein